MATAVLPHISLEQYLTTAYQPDVDYVDGTIEERNTGEIDHSDLQSELISLLRMNSAKWGVRAFAEARVQVRPGNFRVPDVCVMPFAWKRTQTVTTAPLLCIEVLSPEDRMTCVLERCREFLAMGVPEIWIVDPAARMVQIVTQHGTTTQTSGTLTLAKSLIEIDLPRIFSVLDL
jgi:Uma2 family endonuclease